MRQQRITSYFSSQESPYPELKFCFLTLPFKIRRMIYHEAGLATPRGIDMNYWGAFRKERLETLQDLSDSELESYRLDDRAVEAKRVLLRLPPFPLNLLYVCHAIHDEVEKILYSENHFSITRRDLGGLQAIENMSIAALQQLRHILIRVNVSSCIRGCCHRKRSHHGSHHICDDIREHDPPMGVISRSDKQILSQWQRICTRLATNIRPNMLSLYIICDCKDQETAKMVVEPLLSMPVLKDCALRLATKNTHNELQSLAKSTVLRLTGRLKPQSSGPFRFQDLPKEIQLMVLSHTPLIVSHDIVCSNSRLHYMGSCAASGRAKLYAEQGLPREWWCDVGYTCFCTRAHAAFSFPCRCERFPSSYFLVSSKFRQAAMKVFYGGNRFIIQLCELKDISHNSNKTKEMSIIPFLKWFPRDSIIFLASLVLEFLPIKRGYVLKKRSWKIMVAQLYQNANLPALTLEIRLIDLFWHYYDHDDGYDYCEERPKSLNDEYRGHIQDAYCNKFKPMIALRGLKALFFNITYYGGRSKTRGRKELEQTLERMVMGEEYDAWTCGKGFYLGRSCPLFYYKIY